VVKEQGACALWAIAGHTKPQQLLIAQKIGVTQIIDMLLLKSESLQYVGERQYVEYGVIYRHTFFITVDGKAETF